MKNFSIDVDGQGVAVVRFDVPGKGMNVISGEVQREFDEVVETLRADPAIRGAVLVSGKASGFCAGADLTELVDSMARWSGARSQEELKAGVVDAGSWSRRVRALETCGKPVAVVIAGLALGGGLELVLACHYRVAVDDPALRLAFPEAGVGLLPGAGGTQRLPRIMGVSAALPYLLDGKPIGLADALSSGVVHATAPAGELLEMARRWVLEHPGAVAPWDEKGFRVPGGGAQGSDGYRNFAPAMAARLADGGDRFPATGNILKCVYEGTQVPIDSGLRIEARYFFNTARSARSRAMVRTFFLSRQTLAKRPHRDDPAPLLERLRAAVARECQALAQEDVPETVLNRHCALVAVRPEGAGETVANGSAADFDLAEAGRVELRLLYAQVLAALQALDEGLVSDPLEADAIAVSAGFPAWTGGPVSFVEMEGMEAFVNRADDLAARFGPRFQVLPSLRERVVAGQDFYG